MEKDTLKQGQQILAEQDYMQFLLKRVGEMSMPMIFNTPANDTGTSATGQPWSSDVHALVDKLNDAYEEFRTEATKLIKSSKSDLDKKLFDL